MVLVRDRMLARPTTHPVDASLGEARRFFEDDHKHLMLLVEHGVLRGTLTRDDLPAVHPEGPADAAPALPFSTLVGRTVAAADEVTSWHEHLRSRSLRRLAVVDDDERLVGLLCLKRHGRGFCSDGDAAARAEADGPHLLG